MGSVTVMTLLRLALLQRDQPFFSKKPRGARLYGAIVAADPLVSFWNECLTTLSHTVEKLLLFARRVTLGSSKIRFIVIIVRCRPVVDRRPRWRVGKTRSGV